MKLIPKAIVAFLTILVVLAAVPELRQSFVDTLTSLPWHVVAGIIAVVLFLLVAAGFSIFQSLKGRTRPQVQRRRYGRGSR